MTPEQPIDTRLHEVFTSPKTKPVAPTDGQRKRSKRHRIKRNHISRRDRVDSARDFAIYAREVDRKYKAKYHKQEMTITQTH